MLVNYDLMFGMDKWMHFLGYGFASFVLGVFIVGITDSSRIKQRISHAWMALVMLGIAEEYRQYYTPSRSAEFLDAVANILGITAGLGIPFLFWYLIRNRKHTLIKVFVLYSILLIPLLLGLMFVNERPFITW